MLNYQQCPDSSCDTPPDRRSTSALSGDISVTVLRTPSPVIHKS
jgi:hypothetical protein